MNPWKIANHMLVWLADLMILFVANFCKWRSKKITYQACIRKGAKDSTRLQVTIEKRFSYIAIKEIFY
jgi:hypothetical protein